MEFGSIEYQIAVWELFNLGRIGSAMVGIGSILAIWLSLRIAVNTRNNPETNIFAKVMSLFFAVVSIFLVVLSLFLVSIRLYLW